MPADKSIKKAIVLGSAAIRIGQAGEFDYSGSQVLKALKEEGIYSIVINPNIATFQTDPQLADRVYLQPVTVEFVEEIIKKERPDAILLSFGGQTALNVGVELKEKGILDKYGVRVLGTPVEAIEKTEDRELFRQAMFQSGIEICRSKATNNLEDALKIADEIGYPIIVRVAYTLGGGGSGVAYNREECAEIVNKALNMSMISQILVEEYIGGWKEIEYEVVRDKEGNTITVCNMENFDPCGIHTGDSIVIAPSQTLTNDEYQMLRSAAIRAVNHLQIIGECNIQFALHPTSKKFISIEINARLSRSSALASKATGYPLAYVAAKLALGYTLPELKNSVTNITTACFEPALDYVALKIPRWNLEKFQRVSRKIGPQMKSVGEVMALGKTFEEVLQKAVRMLDIGMKGIIEPKFEKYSIEQIKEDLKNPTDQRLFLIPVAIKKGMTIDEIYALSKIDKWFLYKIKHICEIDDMLKQINLHTDDCLKKKVIRYAKKYGFSDGQIARAMRTDTPTIRRLRWRFNIIPVTKQIDTLAAEWPASTNYLYLTYGGEYDDINYEKENKCKIEKCTKKIIVLGSGVYRIGSSVEFDWGCVNMALALKKKGINEVIMINYNPETVSTDYDMSDKLYFEELSGERVLDICTKEKADGLVVSVAGQIGNNLTQKFTKYEHAFRAAGIKILGTAGNNIDKAENRMKFGQVMDQLKIKQPEWAELRTIQEAVDFANKVQFPVLVRPSYVLSGAAMRVAYNEEELREFLQLAADVSKENPVVITKFFTDAREIECDGVSDGENVFIGAVVEHIENAGVHSGDATMCIPAPTLQYRMWEKIQQLTKRIALALDVIGPFNIQYLVSKNEIYVIEMNLRSSRSMPYVSKTRGINLIRLAAETILGEKIPPRVLTLPSGRFANMKVPQFSFVRLEGADPVLGVEMMSTGEVACIGENIPDALIKALIAAEFKIPFEKGNILFTVAGDELKQQIVPLAKKLYEMGYKIFATIKTAAVLKENGVEATVLHKIREPEKQPNLLNYIMDRKIDLVINIPIPKKMVKNELILNDEYKLRRKAIEFGIPIITNLQLAQALIDALEDLRINDITNFKEYLESIKILSLNEYHDQLKEVYW